MLPATRDPRPATRDNLPATRDLRRLDTVFTKLSSLGRLLLIHVFKLQVLVLVDEIYKPERSILRCGQVCINKLYVSIFSLSQTQRKGVVSGEEKIYLSRATRLFSRARFARELANVFKILCTGYSIFHSGSDIREYCT